MLGDEVRSGVRPAYSFDVRDAGFMRFLIGHRLVALFSRDTRGACVAAQRRGHPDGAPRKVQPISRLRKPVRLMSKQEPLSRPF